MLTSIYGTGVIFLSNSSFLTLLSFGTPDETLPVSKYKECHSSEVNSGVQTRSASQQAAMVNKPLSVSYSLRLSPIRLSSLRPKKNKSKGNELAGLNVFGQEVPSSFPSTAKLKRAHWPANAGHDRKTKRCNHCNKPGDTSPERSRRKIPGSGRKRAKPNLTQTGTLLK